MNEKISINRLSAAFAILSQADRRKLRLITVIQMLLSILDLLGVLAIGLLGALSLNYINGRKVSSSLEKITQVLGMGGLNFQQQLIYIGVSSMIFLIGRTALSIYFTRRVLFYLSSRGAEISSEMVSKLLGFSLPVIQSLSSQEMVFALNTGVNTLMLSVIAPVVVLVSDISLLVVMGVTLLVIDPISAIGTFFIFGLVGYSLYRFLNVRSLKLGSVSSHLTIESSNKLVEVLNSYREVVVGGRRDFYAKRIGSIQKQLASTLAELSFMPYISKYVVESAVIFGGALIALTQFAFRDATHAVTTFSIFLAASTRLAPSVLRVQQGMIYIRANLGIATPTLELFQKVSDGPIISSHPKSVVVPGFSHEGFVPAVEINDVNFSYPNKEILALDSISLSIEPGTVVALVGPSGAGKSTLADIILGILRPGKGSILVSGLTAEDAIFKWPGAIGYVPQEIFINEGSFRENITMGYGLNDIHDDRLRETLAFAALEKYVDSLEHGLDSEIGGGGSRVSGGERQRIGIARALLTNPKLLVLDEATSALDALTESIIADSISGMRGKSTLVLIAHRLSTVRTADLIVYMEKGKIITTGDFEHIKANVPNFARQAALMGL